MTSRRGFLAAAAGLAVSRPAFAQRKPILLYVGSYSSTEGPEGSHGRGSGIYLFDMNPSTGALTQREVIPDPDNPESLAFNRGKTRLYTANETSKFQDQKTGSMSAFAVNRATGHLTLINTVSSGAAGPTHVSVHPSDKWLFAANYAGGAVSVLPIHDDGSLGEASVEHDTGTVGPERATSAPAGSFAISGHDHPHAHMVESDPSGRFVIAADLGLDCLLVWKFDAETGKLSDLQRTALPPGDGPRHFVFHPNGHWMYSLQEEGSTLVTFDFDKETGKLTARQTISSLPKNFRGSNFTSEIRISPDARFIYAANRLHDSIAWFPIAKDGTLHFGGEEWTRGDYPRSFTIDPAGTFLFCCNQRADAITSFRVNKKTGALSFTGDYIAVGTPAYIAFL